MKTSNTHNSNQQKTSSIFIDETLDTQDSKVKTVLSHDLVQREVGETVELTGTLDRDDYIVGKLASIQEQHKFELDLAHENNISKLLMFLARVFGCSIAASYVILVLTSTNPNVDKSFVKDTMPNLIHEQEALLGSAIGGYFWTKSQDRKNKKSKRSD